MPSTTTPDFAAPQGAVQISPQLRNALGLSFLWLNASEVFRYFLFVMPMMRSALPGLDGAAPMNVPVFLIWGVWDTVLFVTVSLIGWLYLERFGGGARSVLLAGTLLWAAVFGILWLGVWNMNLTTPGVLLIALPLAWLEMVVCMALLERGWRARLA